MTDEKIIEHDIKTTDDQVTAPEWLANEYEAGNDGQFEAAYQAMDSIDVWGADNKKIHAIDIGCGTGRIAEALARKGWHVDAQDVSRSMVQATQERCKSLRVSASVCDANNLSLEPRKYELVSCCWMLHWLENAQNSLEQMAKSLTPSGHMVLQWSCGQPRSQGFRLRDTLQEVFDRTDWTDRLKEAPLAMFQHPLDEVISCLENAGLEIIATRENIIVGGGENPKDLKRALRSAAFAAQTVLLGDDVDILIEESLQLLTERNALQVANTEIIAKRL